MDQKLLSYLPLEAKQSQEQRSQNNVSVIPVKHFNCTFFFHYYISLYILSCVQNNSFICLFYGNQIYILTMHGDFIWEEQRVNGFTAHWTNILVGIFHLYFASRDHILVNKER